MPQLDMNILEDFLFFAFAGIVLGLGEDDIEEHVVSTMAEAHLASHLLSTKNTLAAEAGLIAKVGQ